MFTCWVQNSWATANLWPRLKMRVFPPTDSQTHTHKHACSVFTSSLHLLLISLSANPLCSMDSVLLLLLSVGSCTCMCAHACTCVCASGWFPFHFTCVVVAGGVDTNTSRSSSFSASLQILVDPGGSCDPSRCCRRSASDWTRLNPPPTAQRLSEPWNKWHLYLDCWWIRRRRKRRFEWKLSSSSA